MDNKNQDDLEKMKNFFENNKESILKQLRDKRSRDFFEEEFSISELEEFRENINNLGNDIIAKASFDPNEVDISPRARQLLKEFIMEVSRCKDSLIALSMMKLMYCMNLFYRGIYPQDTDPKIIADGFSSFVDHCSVMEEAFQTIREYKKVEITDEITKKVDNVKNEIDIKKNEANIDKSIDDLLSGVDVSKPKE